MPAGSTYEPIATTTLSSSAATVTFSSISGSYTDLVLIFNGTLGSSQNCYIYFNSDTGTNYSYTYLYGSGSGASSSRLSNTASSLVNYVGTGQSTTILNINNYSNSTTYKTVLSRSSDAALGVMAVVTLWRSTSAITSVQLKAGDSGTFSTGSTFTLYGITAA